ncbi:MAG: hypothetical protein PHW63_01665 [Alphaproteobacteria bacterium]|nr:hypothetical protein [Alphaproteobacteria bacterium]
MFKRCAREICQKHVKPKIDAAVPNSGFGKAHCILFYAGPDDEIKNAVYGLKRKVNATWKRAGRVAHRLKAKRIDNTEVFKFLMGTDFADIIEDYTTRYGLSDKEKKSLNQEVWNFASARFARTDFKEAVMLVCGAGPRSSFRVKEMVSMLKGRHLEVFNGMPAQMFREIGKLKEKELFRFASMSALILLKEAADNLKTKASMNEYSRQLKYFLADEKGMREHFYTLPVAQREEISHREATILKNYGVLDKFEAFFKTGMGVDVVFPVLRTPASATPTIKPMGLAA